MYKKQINNCTNELSLTAQHASFKTDFLQKSKHQLFLNIDSDGCFKYKGESKLQICVTMCLLPSPHKMASYWIGGN